MRLGHLETERSLAGVQPATAIFTKPDVASRASIYAPIDESITKQENHQNGAVWKRVV
jgi:hypothetical protein